MNKIDYQTMIDVEKAIAKLDRLFIKVSKFHNRRFIDPENHERREKRLQERKKERLDNNYTLYLNGLTEEE